MGSCVPAHTPIRTSTPVNIAAGTRYRSTRCAEHVVLLGTRKTDDLVIQRTLQGRGCAGRSLDWRRHMHARRHFTLRLPSDERLASLPRTVSVEESAAAVKRVFEQNGMFPPHARFWKPGKSVFEGFFLVKRPHGRVEMACQRSSPTNPTELAEQGSTEYEDVDEAVSTFIDKEWSNGIDGIRVIH